jgi:hypothetical protein
LWRVAAHVRIIFAVHCNAVFPDMILHRLAHSFTVVEQRRR